MGNTTTKQKSVADYNIDIHHPPKTHGWRSLYAKFLKHLEIDSIIELGAGTPDFLQSVRVPRRVAIDGGDRWEAGFRESGIEFFKCDLDNDDFPHIVGFDVVVCSDVFEHLLYPDRTLQAIHTMLSEKGMLFSHVPNEFTYKRMIKVMLGLSDAVHFHPHCDEFNDPHLHRFTRIGFERFLNRSFQYNLFISDMKYNPKPKLLQSLGLPVPYAVQGGPTFISVNSEEQFLKLKDIKKTLQAK